MSQADSPEEEHQAEAVLVGEVRAADVEALTTDRHFIQAGLTSLLL